MSPVVHDPSFISPTQFFTNEQSSLPRELIVISSPCSGTDARTSSAKTSPHTPRSIPYIAPTTGDHNKRTAQALADLSTDSVTLFVSSHRISRLGDEAYNASEAWLGPRHGHHEQSLRRGWKTSSSSSFSFSSSEDQLQLFVVLWLTREWGDESSGQMTLVMSSREVILWREMRGVRSMRR
jgi:hypothetical protein